MSSGSSSHSFAHDLSHAPFVFGRAACFRNGMRRCDQGARRRVAELSSEVPQSPQPVETSALRESSTPAPSGRCLVSIQRCTSWSRSSGRRSPVLVTLALALALAVSARVQHSIMSHRHGCVASLRKSSSTCGSPFKAPSGRSAQLRRPVAQPQPRPDSSESTVAQSRFPSRAKTSAIPTLRRRAEGQPQFPPTTSPLRGKTASPHVIQHGHSYPKALQRNGRPAVVLVCQDWRVSREPASGHHDQRQHRTLAPAKEAKSCARQTQRQQGGREAAPPTTGTALT
jgi:hypothetical protein